MDVVDRAERDPAFKALVDLLTAWLMDHPDYTPTELREAAMMAASDVEWMVNRQRRRYVFAKDGTLLNEEPSHDWRQRAAVWELSVKREVENAFRWRSHESQEAPFSRGWCFCTQEEPPEDEPKSAVVAGYLDLQNVS
jgi:hypothetical protein